jgi:hypothetical protein
MRRLSLGLPRHPPARHKLIKFLESRGLKHIDIQMNTDLELEQMAYRYGWGKRRRGMAYVAATRKEKACASQ